MPVLFHIHVHRSTLRPCNLYPPFRGYFAKEGKGVTLFYFQPCFHLVQVFHVNIWSLDLSIEQFEEPVSCLALRRQGAGVSIHLLLLFKDICLISFSYPALPPKDLRSLKEILL